MQKKTMIRLAGKSILLVKAGKHLLILGMALMITAGSFAQESDDEDPGGSGGDSDVPFDGGISLLVAAGVAYGAKKAHEAKKQASYFDGKNS